MITQTEKRNEIARLNKKRQLLVGKLRDHFCLKVDNRDYSEFEKVVDELEDLRSQIRELKAQ